jgi:hypothetical protein
MKAISFPLITTPLLPPIVVDEPAVGWMVGPVAPQPRTRFASGLTVEAVFAQEAEQATAQWFESITVTPLPRRASPSDPAAVVLWEPPPPASTTSDYAWFDPTSRFTRRVNQPPGPIVSPPGLPDGTVIVPPPLVPAGCVHLMDHRLVQSSLAGTALSYSILADRRLLQSGLSFTSLCE